MSLKSESEDNLKILLRLVHDGVNWKKVAYGYGMIKIRSQKMLAKKKDSAVSFDE